MALIPTICSGCQIPPLQYKSLIANAVGIFLSQVALNSKAGLKPALLAACVRKPKKGQPSNAGRFSGGVTCIVVTGNGDLLVGCGNGDVVCVEEQDVKKQGPGIQ